MLKEILPQLVMQGYDCLPIKPRSKVPAVAQWSSLSLNNDVYERWTNEFGGYGVGLRLGNGVYAIDIDVRDADVVDSILFDLEMSLGVSGMQRIGLAPKTCLLFRSDAEMRKRKLSFVDSDGNNHAVEILGKGQQVVAYGVHPDTQRSYTWLGGEPLEVSVSSLTSLDELQVDMWLDGLSCVLPEGWQVVGAKDDKTARVDAVIEDVDFLSGMPLQLTADEIQETLSLVPAQSLDYDGWFKALCAIWHQYGGSDEGYKVAREWSRLDSERYDETAMRSKWLEAGKPASSGRKPTFATLLEWAAPKRKAVAVVESVSAAKGWEDKIAQALDSTALRLEIAQGISNDTVIDEIERSKLITLWQRRYKELEGVTIPLRDVRNALASKRKHRRESSENLDWLDEYVWVTSQDKFYHNARREWMTQISFNASFSRYFPNEEGKVENNAASHFALHVHKIKTVSKALYVPFAAREFVYEGLDVINVFRQESVPVAGDEGDEGQQAVDIVKAHISNLFGERLDQINLFIDWLAHQVQHTGRKVRFAPIIKGIEGDGKSMLANLLKSVLGRENVKVISPDAVVSSFTGWATDAAVGVLEEVRIVGHSRYEVLNKVKPLITNDDVAIHAKGREEYNAMNTMNYIAFTNFADALPISDTDRRWWVIFTPWSTIEEAEIVFGCDNNTYFDRLSKALEQHSAHLRMWLETHQISDKFAADGRAPVTAERAAMIASSVDDTDDYLQSLIKHGAVGVCEEAIIPSYIVEAMQMDEHAPAMTLKDITIALKKMGYTTSSNHRVYFGGSQKRVWVKCHTTTREKILELLEGRQDSNRDLDIPF